MVMLRSARHAASLMVIVSTIMGCDPGPYIHDVRVGDGMMHVTTTCGSLTQRYFDKIILCESGIQPQLSPTPYSSTSAVNKELTRKQVVIISDSDAAAGKKGFFEIAIAKDEYRPNSKYWLLALVVYDDGSVDLGDTVEVTAEVRSLVGTP